MPSRPDNSPSKYTLAELFCGCGGFSHGFKRTGRFHVVLGNDVKQQALETFRFNHTENGVAPAVIKDDIRKVPVREFVAKLEEKNVAQLDCLIGGPPCQGFSQMKRGEERTGTELVGFRGYDKLSHDPRNDLVLRFLEVAQVLHPRVIVIENVPQFLSHFHNGRKGGIVLQVQELLHEMGYEMESDILNAANYGVPQLRKRAVIIASRIGKISLPKPTHMDSEDLLFAAEGLKRWVTVEDAISDLPTPPVSSKDEIGAGPLSLYSESQCREYGWMMRTSPTFPFNHISRKYSADVISIISDMRPGETWDDASDRMRKKYQRLIERSRLSGESPDGTRQRLIAKRQIVPAFFKDYYWSAYTRLAWPKPALTVTANANFLGCGRYTHPIETRGITMREAARLQSFDDEFKFITGEPPHKETTNIGVGMDMIGEAVPPLLARAIAEQILVALDGYRLPVGTTKANTRNGARVGKVKESAERITKQ